MKKKLLIFGLFVFVLGTFTSFAQTVLYNEDFEDGLAQGWIPTASPELWVVAPNENVGTGGNWYNLSAALGNDFFSIYDSASFENFTLTADMYPVWGNVTYIIFNYKDTGNYSAISDWASRDSVSYIQRVNSVNTVIAKGKGGSDWYETGEIYQKWKIMVGAGKVSFWMNDSLIFDKLGAPEGLGKIGLYSSWCPFFVDNINIVSNEVPFEGTIYGPGYFDPYMEDFEDGLAQDWTPTASPELWVVAPNENVGTGGNWYNLSAALGDDFYSILDHSKFDNFTLSADMYPVWGNVTYIIFNYQNSSNYSAISDWASRDSVSYIQKVDGVNTVIAKGKGGSDWYETGEIYQKWKIMVGAGKVSYWMNDSLIFDNLDAPTGAGQIGLYSSWCPFFVDNMKVESNVVTSVKGMEYNSDVQIFPNPVNGQFFSIRTKDFGPDVTVNIYNTAGKLVYTKYTKGQELMNINVNEFNGNNGLYILNVVSGKKAYTGKLLIQ